MRNTRLTKAKKRTVSIFATKCCNFCYRNCSKEWWLRRVLTWLLVQLVDEEVQRLVGLGDQELLEQVLEQFVDVVLLHVVFNLLLEFKFLAFIHFYFWCFSFFNLN